MKIIRKLTRVLPDKLYLQIMYFKHFHKFINFKTPETFNEKLQWLKVYDRRPEYTVMVDKYLAKEYVAEKIGQKYIIPTLGVWKKAEDIDFSALPEQFVLKCNNDSGGIVICKDKSKLDKEEAIRLLSDRLNNNGYWYGREWPYKNVEPCIIAEKYMEDTSTGELRDYNFFCFGGQVKCYKVDYDRFVKHHANYYDRESHLLEFGEASFPPLMGEQLEIYPNIELMMEFAEKLAAQVPFLRTDFYDVDGNIYFGEMIFYSASGFGQFTSHESDIEFGKWIKLPSGGVLVTDRWIVLFTGKAQNKELTDYKIYTFNGQAKLCMINTNRGVDTRADYYDQEFNWLDFTWGYRHADNKPIKPRNYEKMFQFAEILAKGTKTLRVDFYEVDGNMFFGELTFFDGSGFDAISPIEWDHKMGGWIDLNN